MRNKYHGKLLLFGEYLVLNQGAALALPEPRYSVSWDCQETPDEELIQYGEYLESQKRLGDYLKLPLLLKHLKGGWQLVSNVPRHKGLGSSATIVAAVYDRYKSKKDDEISMEELQEVFAVMEDFMHGKSSGFDPLPIYFDQPILRKNNQSVRVYNPLPCLDRWSIELIDSGEERTDSKGIQRYLDRLEKDKSFSDKIETLTKVNNKLVEAVIKNEHRIAENLLRTFSENQLILFADWIPANIQKLWNENQDDNSVIKMLGAGGGGYFLKIKFEG